MVSVCLLKDELYFYFKKWNDIKLQKEIQLLEIVIQRFLIFLIYTISKVVYLPVINCITKSSYFLDIRRRSYSYTFGSF